MPLEKGPSDAARSRNIAEMIRSGKRSQAAAAAYAQQRKSRKGQRSKGRRKGRS